MTLDGIDRALPNGFHDAFLRELAIDYVRRQARLRLDLSVGDPAAPNEADREAYRPAAVLISELHWCIIEPPATTVEGRSKHTGLGIDAGPVSGLPSRPTLPAAPAGAFVWWFFVRDWNAFIYVAANDATLGWTEGQN